MGCLVGNARPLSQRKRPCLCDPKTMGCPTYSDKPPKQQREQPLTGRRVPPQLCRHGWTRLSQSGSAPSGHATAEMKRFKLMMPSQTLLQRTKVVHARRLYDGWLEGSGRGRLKSSRVEWETSVELWALPPKSEVNIRVQLARKGSKLGVDRSLVRKLVS